MQLEALTLDEKWSILGYECKGGAKYSTEAGLMAGVEALSPSFIFSYLYVRKSQQLRERKVGLRCRKNM